MGAGARLSAIRSLGAGRRFTGNIVYLNQPRRVYDALNAPMADQAEYWRQRERVDEVYFRTAWLRSRCEDRRETLAAMLPRADELDELMHRAAGFGDEFALSHSWQGRWRATKLQDSNLLLGWVHLGQSHAAAVEAEWHRENQRVDVPYFEARLRVLELAGVECPSPCTPSRLGIIETVSWRELKASRAQALETCARGETCQHADALKAVQELAEAIGRPEARQARRAGDAHYGRRAEAFRMRFALAVEALAPERGAPLNVAMLRRVLANPEVPRYLDGTEVELLRSVAEEMVAHALIHPTWAIPPPAN